MNQPPGPWGPPPQPPGYPHGPQYPQQYPPQPYYQPPYGYSPPPPPKWYHQGTVVVASIFCCWPIGLAFLWGSPIFSLQAKKGITAMVVMVMVFGMMAAASERTGTRRGSEPGGASTAKPEPPRTTIRVAYSGDFSPAISVVGGRAVADLRIKNLGNEPINGFMITCGDCSGEFTSINAPAASIEEGIFGAAAYRYGFIIKPGREATPKIILSPNKAGNHRVMFQLFGKDGQALVDENGQSPALMFNASVMN